MKAGSGILIWHAVLALEPIDEQVQEGGGVRDRDKIR
jgi:hypothetical protein